MHHLDDNISDNLLDSILEGTYKPMCFKCEKRSAVCKGQCNRCYTTGKSKEKHEIFMSDPYNRYIKEVAYHEEINFDVERNQRVLLHGLHA